MGLARLGLGLLVACVSVTVTAVGCGDSGSGGGFFGDDAGSDGSGASGGAAGAGASGGTGASSGAGGASGSGGSGGMMSCASDSECSGRVCDPTSKLCVDCVFASDCSGSAWCDMNKCVAKTSCNNSLDCVGAAGNRTVCDPATGDCVQCVSEVDCPANNDCTSQRCVPYDACTNSLDCPNGSVCNTAVGRCVECVMEADCGAGQQCSANNTCAPECQSDNQCTPLGKLCDHAVGYCVDCLMDTDCAESQYCSTGACVLDVCRAGTGSCNGNSQVTCRANGSGYDSPQSCPAQTTCRTSGATPNCEPWVCQAGMTYCDPASQDEAVECSADGLSEVSRTNCASSGKNCVNGQCLTQLCTPNQDYCDGNTVKHCSSDGLSSTVTDTCTSNEYCDTLTAACTAQVCSPNQPTCQGDTLRTCNSNGSGFLAGGTDCTAMGQVCSAGMCSTCPITKSVLRATDVDLYFMADRSGSMGTDCSVPSTGSGKWCAMVNGLDRFFQSSANAGVRVALQYQPDTANLYSCSGTNNALATPETGLGALPGLASALRSSLSSQTLYGSSPAEAALRGLISYTGSIASGARTTAGVFLSDGINIAPVTGCSTDPVALSQLVATHYAATNIRTFTLAFANDSIWPSEAEQIAVAGGGPAHANLCPTGMATCRQYFMLTATPAMVESAVHDVQRYAGGCEYVLQNSADMPITTASISLELSLTAGGSATSIPQRASAAACGTAAGWYRSDATHVRLCPTTCTAVRGSKAPVVSAGHCQ